MSYFLINFYVYSCVTENKDYVLVQHTAEFPVRMSRAEISIQINNDSIFEGNENFTISIDSSSLPRNITTRGPSEAIVTIIDDDRELI